MSIKNFLLNLILPKFCFGCKKEGTYLCEDCLATIEIFKEHKKFSHKILDDLFVATDYSHPILKKMIFSFKYEPFAKELAKDLANLIKIHFLLLDKKFDFSDFIFLPVPLSKRRLKWRGFNHAQEIAKELSEFFGAKILENVLIKVKETRPQVTLPEKERKENLKGVFKVKNPDLIFGKKVVLVDDVFTTGTTLSEAGKVLKKAGAKKVIGMVIAIANPNEDMIK
jgi:ComF family protein